MGSGTSTTAIERNCARVSAVNGIDAVVAQALRAAANSQGKANRRALNTVHLGSRTVTAPI